jgi:hypothetical protein
MGIAKGAAIAPDGRSCSANNDNVRKRHGSTPSKVKSKKSKVKSTAQNETGLRKSGTQPYFELFTFDFLLPLTSVLGFRRRDCARRRCR